MDGLYKNQRKKEKTMNTEAFVKLIKAAIVEDYNKTQGTRITENDVYIVWCCKTLQNSKALASTTVNGDGIYYEITYNGDKSEMYLDRYKKQENKCIKL